jgi:hypothetical protein
VNYSERIRYKNALVEFASTAGCFHVTAVLPPGSSADSVEDCLREWDARINRSYLGRSWARPWRAPQRMQGLVFFERAPNHHAHAVVRPPAGACPEHFLAHAALWFAPAPDRRIGARGPKPVTTRGRMLVQRIEDTEADVRRVLGYDAKEMERGADAVAAWRFIDQLSQRQRAA